MKKRHVAERVALMPPAVTNELNGKKAKLIYGFLMAAVAALMVYACATLFGEMARDKVRMGATILSAAEHPKFRDRLPLPALLTPQLTAEGADRYTVRLLRVDHDFGLRATCAYNDGSVEECGVLTHVYAFEGMVPGPTIQVQSGRPLEIEWRNELRERRHLLARAFDPTICGGLANCTSPSGSQVRAVPYLHGVRTPADSDGHPEAWFTADYKEYGARFVPNRTVWKYPTDLPAATLWYHDTALGITRLNNFAGLQGLLLVQDDTEARFIANGSLPLPKHTVPLVIQDKTFNDEGTLNFLAGRLPDGRPSVEMNAFGEFICVNGKLWPYLDVEAAKYRFRVLNAADSRYFSLSLVDKRGAQVSFYQIAGPNGFLPAPLAVESALLAAGERKELVVDFSQYKPGDTFNLTNSAKAPFPNGAAVTDPTRLVMQFRVVAATGPIAPVELPAVLTPLPPLPAPTTVRELGLFELVDELDRVVTQLGTLEDGPLHWSDPVTEAPVVGEVEEWELNNLTPQSQPIHVHATPFQIVGRATLNITDGRVVGREARALNPDDAGAHDVVEVPPHQSARIRLRFGSPGDYVWHCHMLSHQDYEMMRPIRVVEARGDV